jgi:pantoate--beta-alanine ligase
VEVLRTIAALRRWREERRRLANKVGFVPTMGYLHRGHLALIEEAKRRADQVVVSIFVNPKQFGAGEDLDKYPRDLERDLGLCQDLGVDAVFTPEGSEIYPPGFQTRVLVEPLSQNLCGRYRPDFFPGVATVVTKLFCLVQPEVAVFGEKDYQQLVVVRRLSRDLHLGVEVVGHPTVREADGLAMSSRNAYLSPDQRRSALSLSQSLLVARQMVAQGERRVSVLVERVKAMIEAKPHTKVQYAQVVDGETMADLAEVTPHAVMALAVFVGRARLIDNIRLWPDAGEKGI